MRIPLGVAQPFRHAGFETLTDHMLQPFGFVVHLVPVEAQRLGQEGFDQPVVPEQLDGDLAAGLGQARAW